MSSGCNGNRYVTWQSFVALCLPIIAIPIIVGWILLNAFLQPIVENLKEIKQELRAERQYRYDQDRAP